MILYYFDASAWVKHYYQEAGTSWVRDLFAKNQPIACSPLGCIEVTATLARKRKAKEVDPPSLEKNMQELEEDWESFIQVQMTTEAVTIARGLARDLALKGADAVHLASALLLQRGLEGEGDQLIFVTSDHELKEATQLSGLEVIDPEEQERRASLEDVEG